MNERKGKFLAIFVALFFVVKVITGFTVEKNGRRCFGHIEFILSMVELI